ncbi:MAG: CGNR zinc finger domain-containing protein [Ktedonobacterales bacterium]
MASGDISTAAGGLRLVQMLLNTRYGQQARLHDEWPDRVAMEDWLREKGLITAGAVVTEGDFRRAIALRQALREILRRPVNVDAARDDALSTLRGLASHLLLKVQFFSESQVNLVPESSGVDGFLAQVLAETYTAMATGTWVRLKICHNRACSKAFYDGSKNHSGVWCSTRVCGNRMHARTYRQLKKRAQNLSSEQSVEPGGSRTAQHSGS